jgi:predicted permease
MMAFLRAVWFRLRSRFRRDALDAELAEELQVHRDLLSEEGSRYGVDAGEAARLAAVRLGNGAEIRERARDAWSWGMIDTMGRDLRYAARFLRRSPAFTAVAVLSIALGVGANAAVFTIVDRVFLRPPSGVPDAAEVRRLYLHVEGAGRAPIVLGVQAWEVYFALDTFPLFEQIAGYQYPTTTKLAPEWDAPTLQTSLTTWRYFDILGVRPALGRLFVRADDGDAAPLVAVLSHAYWTSRFGGDSAAIGTTIRVSGQQAMVVGVSEAGFRGVDLDPVDAWIPAAPMLSRSGQFGDRWRRGWNTMSVNTLVRLRHQQSEASIAAEVGRMIATLPAEGSFWRERTFRAEFGSLIRALGPSNRDVGIDVALRLAGAATLVLLVACANLGSLLLARGVARERELAVRLAIGVSRGRLFGQLLMEALLVCGIGAVLALLVANYGGRFLNALVFPDGPPLSAPVDARIVAMTLLATVVFGVVASVLPARRASRTDVSHALKTGAQSGPSGHRLRSTLLALQLAFSLVLLVGAGLFTRSLMQATRFDVGFEARQSVMVLMNFLGGALPPPERDAVLAQATDRLLRVEGVREVARTVGWPFDAIHFDRLTIPDRDITDDVQGKSWFLFPVTGSGMRAFGIRLRRGRLLEDSDRSGTAPVVVVSEGMARQLWPGEDPIGKRLRVGADSMPFRDVVGVVQDMVTTNLTRAGEAQFFVPPEQLGRAAAYLVLRVDGDAAAVTMRIRAALTGWRNDFSSLRVQPLGAEIDEQLRPWRLGALVFAGFGIIALALAAIGVFGLVSFVVTRRTAEFGIRAALGATRARLAGHVLGTTLVFAVGGILVGLVTSMIASRWVADLLFHTSARDVVSVLAASLLLLLTTVVATMAPMRRATRVDPASALRAE